VKKLCALLVIGGLLALGCGGTTTTPAKKSPVSDGKASPKEHPKSEKQPADVKTPKIESVTGEGAAIAADKADAEVTIEVACENVDGDITLKITPPDGLKVDKDTVTLKKGEKKATVKVSVDSDKAKREKDEDYKLGVSATAEGAKEKKGEVTVKVAKKK
jgi:hypothetical protein